jgi:ATP-dependent RNA helicase MSS116
MRNIKISVTFISSFIVSLTVLSFKSPSSLFFQRRHNFQQSLFFSMQRNFHKKPIIKSTSNVCFAFQKGNCNRGDSCRYSHVLDDSKAPESAVEHEHAVPMEVSPPQQTPTQTQPRKKAKVAPNGNRVERNQGPESELQPPAPPSTKPKHVGPQARVIFQAPRKENAPFSAPTPEETNPAAQIRALLSLPPHPPSPKRPASVLEQEPEQEQTSYMSADEFRNLNIAPATRKALAEVLKYQYMTKVQTQTLPVILDGKDCLAKAKTGTGKTLAFLIPSIEMMVRKAHEIDQHQIPTLIISPNRELASQIAEEAQKLLSFHSRKAVVCIYGGVKIAKDYRQLNQPNIALMVATPGRLIDHLENTPGFSDRLGRLRFVILDEADQLLDQGFKPAIDRIARFLPDSSSRQTLLFSATVSRPIQDIANNVLRRGYEFVDTVGSDEKENQTHEHVPQQMLVVENMMQLVPAIASGLQNHINENPTDYKILVFFTTARVAGFMSDLFNSMSSNRHFSKKIIEIHSRMSQSARNRASDDFRTKTGVIMFSSDVSARGMDYPDVTFVLQVGSTEKAQYIHRLGRTARAGKEGSGMLLLYDFEERSMTKELTGIPLVPLPLSHLNIAPQERMAIQAIQSVSHNNELKKSAEQAYQAWLGYYNGKLRALGWSKPQLVENANAFARTLGLLEVPALEKKTIGKMGLSGVPGLKIAPFQPRK